MKFLLFGLFLFTAVSAQGETQWQPARTFVLNASITSWPAKAGLESFPGTRYDQALVDQLKAAGVPGEHILFLKDSAATHAAMRQALLTLAARSAPGDTLFFSFQGHGSRQILYTYDYDPAHEDDTVFHMEEIFPLLKGWKGDRLFLIGDCCCSGSLRSVMKQFERERPSVRVATLASVVASNTSTGAWTFTEGLIRAFAGDPIVDRDHDGQLGIAEVDRFLYEQMKYKENQLTSLAFSANFEKSFILRAVAPGKIVRPVAGPHQIGDLLDARDQESHWYPAEIMDAKADGSSYQVHYAGWDDKWNEWVDASRLRPIVKGTLNVGQRYEVLSEKKWYPATITSGADEWFYFAHYDGYSGEGDEWITAERARVPKDKKAKQAPDNFRALDPRPLAKGDTVAARYHDDWYRGRIMGTTNGTFLVRYDDNTTGKLIAAEMIPMAAPESLRVGDDVLAVWEEKAQVYPGRVLAVEPEKATIRWDDGSAPSKVDKGSIARIRR